MRQNLNPIRIGLTPTGVENSFDPRREYAVTEAGKSTLIDFFQLSDEPKINKIWLTPATMEDLLIFHAFKVTKSRAVIIKDIDGDRVIESTELEYDIHRALKTNSEVLINPELYITAH